MLTSPSSAESVHSDDDVSLWWTMYLVALETLVNCTDIETSVLDYSDSQIGAVGTTPDGALVVIETADDLADDPALLLAETATW